MGPQAIMNVCSSDKMSHIVAIGSLLFLSTRGWLAKGLFREGRITI